MSDPIMAKRAKQKPDGLLTRSSEIRMPFVLTCCGCDAGGNVRTVEEAVLSGWLAIQEDAGGVSWNYSGICPDCVIQDVWS